ncbi:hypothetical protein C0991_004890 [Blastosporella zonata]|nr:hypothetical protein C0991_004890 [Blastosporella zonata]
MARHAGVKRKRVESLNTSNENVSHSTRTRTRSKRLRSNSLTSTRRVDDSTASEGEEQPEEVDQTLEDEEGAPSEMDVDTATAHGSDSEASEALDEEQDEGSGDQDEHDDSTEDFLLNSAQPKQLSRLRKNDLIRLYHLVDLSDDPENMTKSDIIAAIIAAREEDFASLPPSSPPGRGDGFSSEGASSDDGVDDGNEAGDEETDVGFGINGTSKPLCSSAGLRRRATLGEGKKIKESLKGRSVSMGHILPQRRGSGRSAVIPEEGNAMTRRRPSNRSSPTTSTHVSISLPLVTRLRSRKVSTSFTTSISTSIKPTRGKGKAKQVEFNNEVLGPKLSSRRTRDKSRQREEAASIMDDESDLTSLDELEASIAKPSPRRLRSKRTQSKKSVKMAQRPAVKGNATSMTAEEEEEAMDDVEEEDELIGDEDVADEDEVDELVSSASATPVPTPQHAFKGRRTPLRTRLRSRQRHAPPPSDGDDEEDIQEEEEDIAEEEEGEEEEGEGEEEEGEGEEEEGEEEEGEEEEGEEEEGEEADEALEDEAGEDDDGAHAVEPRRLRNGKIVGEEDADMEEDITSGDEADAAEDAEEEDGEEADGDEAGEDIDVDADGEAEEDEVMENDDGGQSISSGAGFDSYIYLYLVDLTIATAKTLVRLRRDDLIRLCESRDLEPVGTKPQLAEALLQWRDRQANDFSSPSSCGTVRPSSRRRRQNGSSEDQRPVLLRSEHTHTDEPMTPVPTQQLKDKERLEKEPEQELELDLESLGLEDREIPPEKIQKLEKIGSGGFKDVFIGKFKGRKIAISEFRGQLSAMDIKELKLLGGFDHPNIVRFLGVSIPENARETPVMIVSELCSNGDLFDYVRNVNAPTLHKVLMIMLDIARGLEYLHLRKPSVIHRDCKSSNILITAKGTAKIADFGLAKVKQSTRSMVRSLVGTVNWQAPELWHAHPKYNHKVDVFSCAMVYWEMLQWHLPNKKFPWEGMNEHAIYEIVGTKRQRCVTTGLTDDILNSPLDPGLPYRAYENNGAQRSSIS